MPAPETIALFEREWTVLARLSHPNIVDILDTGDWVFNGQRRPYFVMPLLPGRTLEETIKYSGERLRLTGPSISFLRLAGVCRLPTTKTWSTGTSNPATSS